MGSYLTGRSQTTVFRMIISITPAAHSVAFQRVECAGSAIRVDAGENCAADGEQEDHRADIGIVRRARSKAYQWVSKIRFGPERTVSEVLSRPT